MTETIQILTDKVIVEADSSDQSLATLYNVELYEIIPQFKSDDLLNAIEDHYDLSTIVSWLADRSERE